MIRIAIVGLALALAGCATDMRDPRRDRVPQSESQVSSNRWAGVADTSPVLIRIFKEERTLEMWRRSGDRYVKVRSFDICSMSGELGPKKREGDRQAPEGFYSVTRYMLNPRSIEWLSFNTGYPNAFDRAHGRTGAYLMVHGGCSSRGCYAVRDGAMQDIYAAMRDAFGAGQRSVQLQIYPFHMTTNNMARYGKDPNADFWKQLKAGYDRFESAGQELDVRVIKGRYEVR
jgi:murein L,D-transpeptidase YafK